MISPSSKILVALSGGVDSAVAAQLLVEAGHDVTAVFVVNYDEINAAGASCWLDDYRDAVRVAAHIGIPIIRWNFVEEYKKKVLDYLYHEYEAGRTPNPDVLCNSHIKYGVWLEYAKQKGFDYLATGHYADVIFDTNTQKYVLSIPQDSEKDQTYFLHQLDQSQLAHACFPLAHLTKKEVRKKAEKFALPVAKKAESMGICFVGEMPIKEFLAEKIVQKPGKVLDIQGNEIGTHDGLAFVTIGQRHGFNHAGGVEPLYVAKKNVRENTIIVAHKEDAIMYTQSILIADMHWISGQAPKTSIQCSVRFRHRQTLVPATIEVSRLGTIIKTKKPQFAITPGQFAVVYTGNMCLGGGIISNE